MRKKLPSENYYGFHEVPTYTIDYLFIDYLESKGFDIQEIQKLNEKKDSYIQRLAKLTQIQIKKALIRNKKYVEPTIEDIKKVLYPQLIKQLLELQLGVISYGLYNQIESNKIIGLDNLKKFMKKILPRTQIPDFSFIGLENQKLLELSQHIGTYSRKNNLWEENQQEFKIS